MSQPKIYRHISDDGSPPASEYRPIESDAIWYLVAWDGNTLLGLWMLVPTNSICCEIHTCLLPHAWGERGHRAAQVMLAWVWENTPCQRIVTNVPIDNRLAFHFALDAGMQVYGKNEDSFLKNGKLLDQICLGLSRPRDLPPFEAATSDSSQVLQGK